MQERLRKLLFYVATQPSNHLNKKVPPYQRTRLYHERTIQRHNSKNSQLLFSKAT